MMRLVSRTWRFWNFPLYTRPSRVGRPKYFSPKVVIWTCKATCTILVVLQGVLPTHDATLGWIDKLAGCTLICTDYVSNLIYLARCHGLPEDWGTTTEEESREERAEQADSCTQGRHRGGWPMTPSSESSPLRKSPLQVVRACVAAGASNVKCQIGCISPTFLLPLPQAFSRSDPDLGVTPGTLVSP